MSLNIITNQPRNKATNHTHGQPRQARALYEAICIECETPTMLPFKPSAERPGYCLSCFSDRSRSRSSRGPAGVRPAGDSVRSEMVREEHHGLPSGQRRTESHSLAAERSSSKVSSEVFASLNIQPSTRSALSRMGITVPTPIQEQTIPWLNEGRDVVGQAMTGSGKTLAFGIPLVEGSDRSARGIQGLVLVPTRELAIQVASVIDEVSSGRSSVMLLYGGRPLGGEKKALQKGAQIVVGTPGRTLDHLRQGNLELGSIRILVLDEADEMLDRGFARDVEAIIAATPTKRQTALFSATLPEWVAKTASKHLRDPKTVQVIANEGAGLKIEHLIYRIDKTMKLSALQALLDQRGDAPIIVFGKTKHGVKKLAKQLVELGYPVSPLQGNMSQNAREKVMTDFRSGKTPVLVATNVAARGLDVEGIAQVINFDLPDSLQLFTHRVGRTGRMGKSGEAITFVTPDDDKKWREIERGFDSRFTIKPWGVKDSVNTEPFTGRSAAASQRQTPERQVSPGYSKPSPIKHNTRQRNTVRPQRNARRHDPIAGHAPKLEPEQPSVRRSSHTPPPNAPKAKSNRPWLRFGHRD